MAVIRASRRLRIAVLICYAVSEPIASNRGQFDRIFAAWLEKAAAQWSARQPANGRVVLELTGWDVVGKKQYPPSLSEIDAIVVTGSDRSAYDDEPWVHKLAAFIHGQQFPLICSGQHKRGLKDNADVYNRSPSVKIFGGCFGHQIISQVVLSDHGICVQKNPNGWEVGVHQVDVAPGFAERFPGLLDKRKLRLQFLHGDHVTHGTIPPRGWIQMGSSELCENHGWLKPGQVLTYQGHPEFDSFINKWSVVALEKSTGASKETVNAWLEQVNKEDDRMLAGELAIEFFLS